MALFSLHLLVFFQTSVPLSSNTPVLPMFIHDTYPSYLNSNSHDLSLTNTSFNDVSFQSQPQLEPALNGIKP